MFLIEAALPECSMRLETFKIFYLLLLSVRAQFDYQDPYCENTCPTLKDHFKTLNVDQSNSTKVFLVRIYNFVKAFDDIAV